MKTVAVSDYHFRAAGRVWNVPVLHLTVLPDGSEGISEAEIRRIHAAIGNEICGSPGPLTVDELSFLCDVTDTLWSDLARHLDLHKSTLSKWRAAGQISKSIYSTHLKKLFWFKMFGDRLGTESIVLNQVQNEQEFLRYAHERAIHEKAADPVELLAA